MLFFLSCIESVCFVLYVLKERLFSLSLYEKETIHSRFIVSTITHYIYNHSSHPPYTTTSHRPPRHLHIPHTPSKNFLTSLQRQPTPAVRAPIHKAAYPTTGLYLPTSFPAKTRHMTRIDD